MEGDTVISPLFSCREFDQLGNDTAFSLASLASNRQIPSSGKKFINVLAHFLQFLCSSHKTFQAVLQKAALVSKQGAEPMFSLVASCFLLAFIALLLGEVRVESEN